LLYFAGAESCRAVLGCTGETPVPTLEVGVALSPFCEDDVRRGRAREKTTMNNKTKLILGILTALAMLGLTFALPRGSAMRDGVLVQFPITVGVWAIFVLLFVKLK
jgi:hypothetical protein